MTVQAFLRLFRNPYRYLTWAYVGVSLCVLAWTLLTLDGAYDNESLRIMSFTMLALTMPIGVLAYVGLAFASAQFDVLLGHSVAEIAITWCVVFAFGCLQWWLFARWFKNRQEKSQ